MNKAEMIYDAAELCGLSQSVVRRVLEAADYAVKRAVQQGEHVFLFGLGKLEVRARGEKKARNLHSGEVVMVPPRRVVAFKASDSLLAHANVA